MREIKFRVWDVKLEQMFYPQGNLYITGSDWPHLAGKMDFTKWPTTDAQGGGSIIQQFTGLKDINGKDIYEGDIIKTYKIIPLYDLIGGEIEIIEEKEYSQVIYNYYECRFEMAFIFKNKRVKQIRTFNKYIYTNRQILKFEVIGNIFENIELL